MKGRPSIGGGRSMVLLGVSALSGRDEVYVRPYPEVETSLVQVSGDGGGATRILYDPAPDGQRFLVLDIGDGRGADGTSRPVVVQNFLAELRARVPR